MKTNNLGLKFLAFWKEVGGNQGLLRVIGSSRGKEYSKNRKRNLISFLEKRHEAIGGDIFLGAVHAYLCLK